MADSAASGDDRVAKLVEQAEWIKHSLTVEASDILTELVDELQRWFAWSGGQYPDDSPGDVIAAYSDGTIVLDDGITTWNPLRALVWIERRREENAERASKL